MVQWELIIVILASLLVGAFLPVLFIFAAALNTIRRQLTRNSTRFDLIMERALIISQRIEVASREMESSGEDISHLTQSARGLAEQLKHAEKSVRMFSSLLGVVLPAATAFIKTFVSQSTSNKSDLNDQSDSMEGETP